MKIPLRVLVGACAVLSGSLLQAETFNFYLMRVGDGVATLNANGAALSLLEMTTDGTSGGTNLLNIYNAPTSGASTQITQGGTFSTTGSLDVSLDGNHLMFTGWGASVGSTLIGSSGTNGTTRTATPIVIGDFNLTTKTFDTSTRLTNVFTGSNSSGGPNGVASVDGSSYWLTGSLTGGNDPTYGLVYAANGATTGINQLSSNGTSSGALATTDVEILDGTVYVSRGAGTSPARGVYSTNNGLDGSQLHTMTILPGGAFSNSDAYSSFEFLNDSTMLVTKTTGIEVFTESGGNWTKLTGLNQSFSSSSMRQMGLVDNGTGTAMVLYTVSGGTSNNSLWAVPFDTTALTFGTAQQLLSAGANYTFTGVAGLTTVPEPSSIILLSLAGAGAGWILLRRRRF